MNEFFTKMTEARKNKATSFVYNGTTYHSKGGKMSHIYSKRGGGVATNAATVKPSTAPVKSGPALVDAHLTSTEGSLCTFPPRSGSGNSDQATTNQCKSSPTLMGGSKKRRGHSKKRRGGKRSHNRKR